MNAPITTHVGPLGSTIYALRADPETVEALAAVDWSRHFSRVCLDPVRGLITLMAPSFPHEDLTGVLEDLVDAAASAFAGAARGLRHTRLRGPGEPPGTGMEPDCAFYVGARARAFREALREGEEAAVSYIERTAPDLVVEVEITNVDEGKIARYGALGVRELWRLRGTRESRIVGVDFFAFGEGAAPRELGASEVLHGLTAGDVREAARSSRLSMTRDERVAAVDRIVRRRKLESIRVREEGATYAPSAPTRQPAPELD